MANSTVESELEGLEKRYWQAMVDGDVETALELTDFPASSPARNESGASTRTPSGR